MHVRLVLRTTLCLMICVTSLIKSLEAHTDIYTGIHTIFQNKEDRLLEKKNSLDIPDYKDVVAQLVLVLKSALDEFDGVSQKEKELALDVDFSRGLIIELYNRRKIFKFDMLKNVLYKVKEQGEIKESLLRLKSYFSNKVAKLLPLLCCDDSENIHELLEKACGICPTVEIGTNKIIKKTKDEKKKLISDFLQLFKEMLISIAVDEDGILSYDSSLSEIDISRSFFQKEYSRLCLPERAVFLGLNESELFNVTLKCFRADTAKLQKKETSLPQKPANLSSHSMGKKMLTGTHMVLGTAAFSYSFSHAEKKKMRTALKLFGVGVVVAGVTSFALK